MKKLYICEYPYVLFKTLIERMGDEDNSYSLILGDSRADIEPMVSVLRKSGLFERVEFFSSKPYKDFYDLILFKVPRSHLKDLFLRMKNYSRVLFRLKKFKKIEFPFELDFKQYDKIINSDGVYVINGYLNMNHIEYSVSEHAKNAFQQGILPAYYRVFFCMLGILDKLHVLIGPRSAAGFCKEIIVNDATDMPWPFRGKKVISWNVDEHIQALSARQKDRIFQLYAESFGLNIDASQTFDLLLTTPLYGDGILPSEESHIKFYKDLMQDYFNYPVLIKPHPRDKIDYKKYFPEYVVIDRGISAEILSFSQNLKLGTVLTVGSTSAPPFREKAENVIILCDSETPITQVQRLKDYQ